MSGESSSTKSLVDPGLLPFLEQFPVLSLTDESLAVLRETRAAARQPLTTSADGVGSYVKFVPGTTDSPDVRLVIYRPTDLAGAFPCILHMHGGGYIMGDPDAVEAQDRRLAGELRCVVVSVDYRLAPETRAPGPVEDCYAALAWTMSPDSGLGIDTSRVGVLGESAGGGLAAALALLARDRGEFKVAFQHLIYPMIDDRTCRTSAPNPFAGEFIWSAESNQFGWKCLLGEEPGGEDVSPYNAAARAPDLSDLPPTYIAVGALDLFIDENLEYARRLIRAGVPTELHVYPGAFHGFDLDPTPRVSQVAATNSLAALRQFLGSQ